MATKDQAEKTVIGITTLLCLKDGYGWNNLKEDPYRLYKENVGARDCNWYLDLAREISAYMERVKE